MRHDRRTGFTLLELVVSVTILAIVAYVAWDAYTGGTKQTQSSTEHLSAMQNALILMEAIQEDLRQISILNQYGKSLMGYSMLFSINGKSFMMRKSTLKDTSGSELGSAFTIVVYQLMEHPTMPGVYTINRIERAADGKKIADLGRESDETIFRSLLVRDMRFDMVVRMENMSYRTYVRVSLTGVNATVASKEPKLYFVSNIFDIPSPEIIHNEPPNPPGFAKLFVMSQKFNLIGSELKPGPGFDNPLPPANWTDPRFRPFCDFIDKNGQPKNFDLSYIPPSVVQPFEVSAFSAPPLRRELVVTAVQNLSSLLSQSYRGRILGQIVGRTVPGQTAAWQPISFSFDATAKTTSTLATQINGLLGRAIPRGTEAVQEVGHTLGGRCAARAPCPTDPRESMITTCTAQQIITGR